MGWSIFDPDRSYRDHLPFDLVGLDNNYEPSYPIPGIATASFEHFGFNTIKI